MVIIIWMVKQQKKGKKLASKFRINEGDIIEPSSKSREIINDVRRFEYEAKKKNPNSMSKKAVVCSQFAQLLLDITNK